MKCIQTIYYSAYLWHNENPTMISELARAFLGIKNYGFVTKPGVTIPSQSKLKTTTQAKLGQVTFSSNQQIFKRVQYIRTNGIFFTNLILIFKGFMQTNSLKSIGNYCHTSMRFFYQELHTKYQKQYTKLTIKANYKYKYSLTNTISIQDLNHKSQPSLKSNTVHSVNLICSILLSLKPIMYQKKKIQGSHFMIPDFQYNQEKSDQTMPL